LTREAWYNGRMACSTRHDSKGKMAGSYSRVVLTSDQISLFPKRRCMRLRPRFWLWAERESHKVPLRLFDQNDQRQERGDSATRSTPGTSTVLYLDPEGNEKRDGRIKWRGWGCRKVSRQVLGVVQCLLCFWEGGGGEELHGNLGFEKNLGVGRILCEDRKIGKSGD
jgi:hypothetical protein